MGFREDLNDDGIDRGKSKKSEKKSGSDKGKVDEGMSSTSTLSIKAYLNVKPVKRWVCLEAQYNIGLLIEGCAMLLLRITKRWLMRQLIY